MDLREAYRARARGKPNAQALLDELFVNPYITVRRAAGVLKTSLPTARQAVALLQRAGMLEETTGRAWGKVFLAKPILRIIEKPDRTQ